MSELRPNQRSSGQAPAGLRSLAARARTLACQIAVHIEQFVDEISSMIDQVNRLPVLSISDIASMGCHVDRPSDR
jgi:hypothetical protein